MHLEQCSTVVYLQIRRYSFLRIPKIKSTLPLYSLSDHPNSFIISTAVKLWSAYNASFRDKAYGPTI